jgi:hypothetical protein
LTRFDGVALANMQSLDHATVDRLNDLHPRTGDQLPGCTRNLIDLDQ